MQSPRAMPPVLSLLRGLSAVGTAFLAACQTFLTDWVNHNIELIDKYQVDALWFDNGVNSRTFDPLKMKVAACYYNRAKEWGKEVTIMTKDSAYLAGSVEDFEKVARAPTSIQTTPWVVDHPIGSTWGYTSDMTVAGAATVINKLIDIVSKILVFARRLRRGRSQ